jgi:hypothetical protein
VSKTNPTRDFKEKHTNVRKLLLVDKWSDAVPKVGREREKLSKTRPVQNLFSGILEVAKSALLLREVACDLVI